MSPELERSEEAITAAQREVGRLKRRIDEIADRAFAAFSKCAWGMRLWVLGGYLGGGWVCCRVDKITGYLGAFCRWRRVQSDHNNQPALSCPVRAALWLCVLRRNATVAPPSSSA